MKYLVYLGVLIGLYVFGRVIGPHITPVLVDEEKSPVVSLTRNVKVAGSGINFEVNLAEMRDSELPEMIKMTVPFELPLIEGGGKKVLVPNDEVKLLNRNGDMMIIETLDQLAKGEVPIASTNIFQVVAQAKFDAIAGANTNKAENDAVAQVPAPPTKQQTKPTETAPEKVVKETPPAKVEPVVEETPEPEPEPAAKTLTPEQIVEAMKASIKAGDVKEFTFEQVRGWKASDDEEIDGETFQVGLAVYKAETIFGVRDVQAKALFSGGELQKWIYAKTGMQIR